MVRSGLHLETRLHPSRNTEGRRRSCWRWPPERPRTDLLGVGLDQTRDELLDGAGLGQVALGSQLRQLRLGEVGVRRAGLPLGLLALLPLGLRSLAGLLALGLLDRV